MSTVLREMVHALRTVTKAEAVALINRDGSLVATALPEGISQETFSIMCAAILGAGMTAATELGHAAPHRILMESEDATFLIQEVGRRAMLVLVVPPERRLSEFETALERALQRGQEGLPPEETIRAYQTTYFPAQEIHFRVDEPQAAADVVWVNDPRLGKEGLRKP